MSISRDMSVSRDMSGSRNMNETEDMSHNSRRTFIRNSGIALTAALAAANACATPADDATIRLALLEANNAIRALQQRCFSLLEQGATHELALLFSDSTAQASCVYPAMQLDSRLTEAGISVANDRLTASARFHGRVQLAAALAGNGTLQQMARLQGINSTDWWEQGEYAVKYVKVANDWKILTLHYRKT